MTVVAKSKSELPFAKASTLAFAIPEKMLKRQYFFVSRNKQSQAM
jgi:hypothetical protein